MKISDGSISLPTASAISKMVKSVGSDQKPNKIELGTLESIATSLTSKNKITEDLLQLLPDLEFCATTTSTSIVSPNDMLTKTFTIDFENIIMGSELKGTIADVIKQQVNGYYKVSNNMDKYVKDGLFMKGANVEAYIPEAALDEIIGKNKHQEKGDKDGYGEITIESALKAINNSKTSVGIFANNNLPLAFVNKQIEENKLKGMKDDKEIEETITLESAVEKKNNISAMDLLNVEFSDNISCLFTNELELAGKKSEIGKLYTKESVTTESAVGNDVLSRLFKSADDYEEEAIVQIPEYNNTVRKSFGRPLKLELDMEIVKPIWAGKPSNHIGYLILLDEKSNIVSPKNHEQKYTKSTIPVTFYNNTSSMKDNLISKAVNGLSSMTQGLEDLENIEEIYCNVLHNTIVKKIRDGKLKEIGELSKDQKFLNIMFTRALEGKKTRILFLPESLVSYFAYEFRENGMGISRLEKINIIVSMRVIMLFAKLMANIKNSIPLTKVTANIDKDTPDIIKAVNDIVTATAKTHQVGIPIGISNVNDIVSWMHNAGYVYDIKSEKLPDTTIDISDNSRAIKTPEDTISEILEELSYMAFFMNSQMVRSGMDANFATTIITQNKLYENRIVAQQIVTEQLLTDRIKKIVTNDEVIRKELVSSISENLSKIKNLNKDTLKEIEENNTKTQVVEKLLDVFIENMVVRLPRPTSYSEGTNLKTILGDYAEAVDKYLEIAFDAESFDSTVVGDISDKIPQLKSVIKKVLVQDWINENNYIPGMSKFLTLDDDGESNNNIFNKYSDFMETFSKLANPFLKQQKSFRDKNDKKLQDIDEGGGEDTDGDANPMEGDTTGETNPLEGDAGKVEDEVGAVNGSVIKDDDELDEEE